MPMTKRGLGCINDNWQDFTDCPVGNCLSKLSETLTLALAKFNPR